MGEWEVEGRRFEVVVASDVHRDGMALELADLGQPQELGPVLEVFWSDDTRSFTFIAHREVSVPMEVVAKLLETARAILPPNA